MAKGPQQGGPGLAMPRRRRLSAAGRRIVKPVFRKVSLLVPILIGMIWINWSVDPVMLYDGHFEDPSRHPYVGVITQDLLAGKSHSPVALYSERLVDEAMFRARPQIDMLVLGTSMAKPIHREMFPGLSFFNASLCGGRFEEMITMWEIARSLGVRPKRVLLQLDTRATVGKRIVPISAEWSTIFRQARQRLCGEDEPLDHDSGFIPLIDPDVAADQAAGFTGGQGLLHPYDTLISPRYLQLSLLFLWTKWLSSNAIPVLFVREDRHKLFADGSVEWCKRWRLHKPADFHFPTEQSQVPVIAAEWMRPVESQRRLFEAFVLDIQKSGAQVEFVLLPSNPWFYGLAKKEFQEAGKTLPSADTETYLRAFAAHHRIRIHGSLDPARAGVVEEDFVDMLHMRRASVARLFASEKEGRTP